MSIIEQKFEPVQPAGIPDFARVEPKIMTNENRDYWIELMDNLGDITERDIEEVFLQTDADSEELEIWQTRRNSHENSNEKNKAEEYLMFFAYFLKLSKQEKVDLYVFAKTFPLYPGVHDIRSKLTSYLATFPNDRDWVQEAKKQLN
jgi:hypothetical protein